MLVTKLQIPVMAKPIFYDPQRKRWGRLLVLLNAAGLVITALVVFFIFTVLFQSETLKPLLLPAQKRNWKAIKEAETRRHKTLAEGTHRKTKAPPSDVVLNADEGIRAAFYVTWDATSFVALKEYYQIGRASCRERV